MIDNLNALMKKGREKELLDTVISLYSNIPEDADIDALALSLSQYTMDHFLAGDYDNFIYFSDAVKRLCYQAKSPKAMIKAYELDSTVSYLMEDYESCLSVLQEFSSYTLTQGYSAEHIVSMGNIAAIYLKLGEYDLSMKMLNEAIDLVDKTPEAEYVRMNNYGNKARILILQGDLGQARIYLEQCLVSEDILESKGNTIETYVLMAKYHTAAGDKTKALEWMKKAVGMISDSGMEFIEKDTYREIADTYYALERYKESCQYLYKYSEINEASVKKLIRLTHKKAELEMYLREKELLNQRLLSQNKEMERRSERDYLTGVYNRAYITKLLKLLKNRFEENGDNYSLLMFDIDGFKSINDTYGHQVGDRILKELSKRVEKCLDGKGFFARTGGDEFVVCFAGKGKEEVGPISESIREAVCGAEFLVRQGRISVSISGGLADARANNEMFSDDISETVDALMYMSKSKGKNRITVL